MSPVITTTPVPQAIRISVVGPPPVLPRSLNPNLDFLRAFAVSLVFVGHLLYFHGQETLGPLHLNLLGALGVLLFFVHTCCVLMLSLERQEKQPGSVKFFLSFMIRRCFRIYPLSMVVVLLVAIFHLPMGTVAPGHFAGLKPDGGDLIANFFLVMDLSHRTPMLGPMWSLPYEMQMYLFLPWLYLLIRPNRALWRIAGVWAIAVAAPLGWIFLRHSSNPNLATYIPCFLPGIFAYQLQRKIRPRVPAYLWPPTVVLLAVLFLCGGLTENWPLRWALCLGIGLAIPSFTPISTRWLVAATHLIAKYSYGIYLSHFFCIWFAFDHLHDLPALGKWALFLLLAAGLPVLLYHLLEEPMIGLGKKIASQYESTPVGGFRNSQVAAGKPAVYDGSGIG